MENEQLKNCNDISVYLGGNCNFNCTYCDRNYIKDMGFTTFDKSQIPSFIRFLRDIANDHSSNDISTTFPVDMISFFGGEPFVFIKVMDEIMEEVIKILPGIHFLIQTNGSLIIKHRKFIQKWSSRLRISISHDFSFQSLNRSDYDIGQTLDLLNECNVAFVQMQHVLPVNRADAFSVDHLASIVKIFGRHKVDRLSLIPLRHLRGHGRFKTFVKDVPLDILYKKLIQLVQLLWVYGIPTVVDGMEHTIEKSYFTNHKQLVVAPDGYLYPEYDFVEYKVKNAKIGTWETKTSLQRSTNDDHLIWDKCKSCSARNECGIKYLYKIFNQEPDGFCVFVNRMYMAIINHNLDLRKSPNLVDMVQRCKQ